MVKKKSFWLILLTVLTAAVLAFCACGLAGCSSEPDDNNDGNDETQQGSGTEGSGTEGSGTEGGGTEGGGTEGGGTEGGGTEGGGTEGGGTGDGSFTLQGFYGFNNADSYWGIITFNANGSGYFATYEDGELNESFSDDITWEYVDDDEMEIEAEMPMFGQTATFPVSLAKVNGELVSGEVYIKELTSDTIFYEKSVVGALESAKLVGDSHAQLVLKEDTSCVVVINGTAETGEWDWDTDEKNLTVSVSSSTYTTTSVTTNAMDQIRGAEFETFGEANNVSFLPIGMLDNTLYSFVSAEGYTLIMNDDGTFETTVDDITYTGVGNTSTLALADDDADETYTPTLEYDTDDPTVIVSATYEKYFGGKTNVTFTLPENITSREDNENYQKYYNHETKGQAIAVFTGVLMTETDGVAEQANGNEYWIFLYRDGTFIAHIYADYIYGNTDGAWTWAVDEESDSEELVPTFIRNYGKENAITYHAYKNEDGSYSFHMTASTITSSQYYVYTFDMDDMPAGAFEGTVAGDEENTYYLVLYLDGTFKAHLGATNTSDGYWQNTETGIEFGKLSADYSGYPNITYTYVSCESTTNQDGTVSVVITNYSGTEYTYIVDPSVVPIGGADLSQYKDTT